MSGCLNKLITVGLIVWFLPGICGPAKGQTANKPPLRLWYDHPAGKWEEGLPIGNGSIGAMVHGTAAIEKLTLNHDRLWRKMKGYGEPPDVAAHLPEVRKLFFEGNLVEAAQAAHDKLGIITGGPDPFQPVGHLLMQMHPVPDLKTKIKINKTDGEQSQNQAPDIQGYRRQLDLNTATVKVDYHCDGVHYTREMFASYPDGMIVIRLTADKPGQIAAVLELGRIDDPDCTIEPWAQENSFGFRGRFKENLTFAVAGTVLCNEGETVSDIDGSVARLSITNANEAVILLTIATDHETPDPKKMVTNHLSRPMEMNAYAEMYNRHVKDYQNLFDRLEISLGGKSFDHLSTNLRLKNYHTTKADPDLMVLGFQMGRYLLISCSRPGSAPANLQGLWNDKLRPPWNSDFHHDINLQMNYWPAEVGNLSECADPLFDYLDGLLPAARLSARRYYGCRGIFVPITNDIWARCLKVEGNWSEWTGAAAWLAQHYWWRYEFTGDKEFLRKRAYPYLKEIALFYQDYLLPDPRPEHRFHGRLVTVPSQSPENHFVGGTQPVSLCISATMDIQLINEVFTHLIEASRILGVDADQRNQWQLVIDSLPPMQIGKYGQLQEWLEDHKEGEPGHRHNSHLIALYPGDGITLERTPKLVQAVQVSLQRRLAAGSGGGMGWSRAWLAAMFARLRDQQSALSNLERVFDFATENMLNSCSGVYQIDGTFGFTAGMAEMLLQSHHGIIRLLPALPDSWAEGHVRGLCARGGFEVEMAWQEGKIEYAVIISSQGNTLSIQSDTPLAVTSDGKKVPVKKEDHIITFPTQKGSSYRLSRP